MSWGLEVCRGDCVGIRGDVVGIESLAWGLRGDCVGIRGDVFLVMGNAKKSPEITSMP